MLARFKLYLFQHFRAATQSLNYLCNSPLSTGVTSGVIAVALALPTLFWVFSDNLNQLTQDWQRSKTIMVYLQLGISEEQQFNAVQKIEAVEGVSHAEFRSAAQGLSELKAQDGMKDIMNYLPENPLPGLVIVTPESGMRPEQLQALVQRLQHQDLVEQAKLDVEWVQRLDILSSFTSHFASSLLILLSFSIILIIVITLRLSVQKRLEEIQVLKLIGAQNHYISRPFLYSGVWYSFIGAIFAIFLVNVFLISFGMAFNEFLSAYEINYSYTLLSMRQILLLMLFAIIIGGLGAKISVKRQLALIEPQI